MAEYVVTFVLDKIASYLIEEANSLSDIHDEVASIEGELRRMQCFLRDADSKQVANERVRNWVADIRDVAYDTEDVVEYYIFRLAQRRRKGFFPFFKRYVFSNELILRRKVREQIKGIRIRLQVITNSRSTYGIENIVEASQKAGFAAGSLQEKRRSSPYDCEDDVIGLAEDTKAVEAQLIYGESRLSVISIIGMAGIEDKREFSISKAKEDRFLEVVHEDSSDSFPTGGHRVGIHFDIRNLKRYRLLHVLDLEGVYLPNLDCAVGDLIHLRYLGLRATWLRKLPSSIGYLVNLQALDLRSTLIDLVPFGIWKFRHLRNLYLNEQKEMVINPPKGPILANLQMLRGIRIGSKSRVEGGLDKLTFIRELELRGALHLQEEALAKWISSCKNLECLKLHDFSTFGNFGKTYMSIPNLMTFSGHCRLFKLHIGGFIKKLPDLEDFPPYLTELSLEGSFLLEDPMLKLEKLPNLRVLKLKQSSFVGKELICSRGGFTQLHFLKLSFLFVEKLRIEDGALSNLRQLEIIDCKQIKIVPNGLHPIAEGRTGLEFIKYLQFKASHRDLH
ncbi:unnamed protein product [Fraxinus pennsylvanica]|uniref:Rx N-terminal domain-containing protein n=1 Tax=Fraxinus pennsylvanica TaxID=56036 RepID=A0AAD2A3P1_9LAMI|nr:unnamed protein product [Fraxinus pennsylvanica]